MRTQAKGRKVSEEERDSVTKIGKSDSIARALVEAWAATLYTDDQWHAEGRRHDAVYVLEALCDPAADAVFTTLNGERTRRQLEAEKARRKAEKEANCHHS
jgi:hypothetical protein